MNANSIRVLSIDDHPIVREAKGHGAFRRMTGESPTLLFEWLKVNQTAIEGDGTFQPSPKSVDAR